MKERNWSQEGLIIFDGDKGIGTFTDTDDARIASAAPILHTMLTQALEWTDSIADSLIAQHEGDTDRALTIKVRVLTEMRSARELLHAISETTN